MYITLTYAPAPTFAQMLLAIDETNDEEEVRRERGRGGAGRERESARARACACRCQLCVRCRHT
jgi:hypothetical protein